MGFLRTPNDSKIAPEVHQIPIALLEQSSSSDEEEDVGLQVQLPRKVGQASRHRLLQALQDGISCRNCKVGRRWSRRLDNGTFLQNLTRQGEDDLYEDIIQQEPSVFERLLCDEKAMEIWDSFISKPEEEQRAILTKRIALHQAKEREAKETLRQDSLDKNKPAPGKKCFKKICPLVQQFLNSEQMPKGTLLSLEPCIIQFFLAEPAGQYVTDPLGNDDRKVLHGLAQYMDLSSQSFNAEVSYEHRCTRVTNTKSTFTAPAVRLSEFLGIS